MSDIQMKSLFSERIELFLAEKQALGFCYDNGRIIMSNFDRFCIKNFPVESFLTQGLAIGWAKRRDGEQNQTMRGRHSLIREFAKYLISSGESAYLLPVKIVGSGAKSIPYIFEEEEILAFWDELDKIRPRYNSPYRHIVLPAMFRVMYCCGLRPQEVRKLATCDVDLTAGKIFIRESKERKDRIVMMADDVAQLCRTYDKKIQTLLPHRNIFFPCKGGEMYNQSAFGKAIIDVWKGTGLKWRGHRRPRNYDFRHTFATHRLYKWMHEGKDLTAMLPYLSEYMGHVNLSSTFYYVHLVPGMFESMSGVDYSQFQDLIPEVDADDE